MRSMGHVTHGDTSDADHGPAATGDDVIHRVCSLRLSLPTMRCFLPLSMLSPSSLSITPKEELFQSPAPTDDTDVGVMINV
ncbi:MAG: hypothetical protein ACYCO7_10455, partial [Acidithiobacillus ferrooxidans]